jgi:hypothetical protein
MAKSAAQLEQELELKRTQLHARVDGLRHRTTDDVQGMQQEAQAELADYVHKAETHVKRHMLLALAGGLGSGIVLGSRSRQRARRAKRARPEAPGKRRTPLVVRGAGKAFGLAGGQVKHEMREAMHVAAAGLIARAISGRGSRG